MKSRIEIGDNVMFNFVRGDDLVGEVLYMPLSSGDLWVIKSQVNTIVYVSTYQTVCLLPDYSVKNYVSLNELQKMQENLSLLSDAAKGVIDRWDSPKWKDEPHTAEFIDKLRDAYRSVNNRE